MIGTPMSHRTRLALAAVVVAAVVLVVALAVCHRDTAIEPHATRLTSPAVVRYDAGGLRYTYHIPTGREFLFDLAADPRMLRNLADERPDDVRRMREELQRRIGVSSLDELRSAHRDTIERLEKLGYF